MQPSQAKNRNGLGWTEPTLDHFLLIVEVVEELEPSNTSEVCHGVWSGTYAHVCFLPQLQKLERRCWTFSTCSGSEQGIQNILLWLTSFPLDPLNNRNNLCFWQIKYWINSSSFLWSLRWCIRTQIWAPASHEVSFTWSYNQLPNLKHKPEVPENNLLQSCLVLAWKPWFVAL